MKRGPIDPLRSCLSNELRLGWRIVLALAASVAAGSCSDVVVPDDCGSASFVVNVTATTQPSRPRYSWNEGPAFELRVSRLSDPVFAAWRIAAADPNAGFASPVDHGLLPNGSTLIDGDESTLSSGVRYCVTVTLVDGQEGVGEFRL